MSDFDDLMNDAAGLLMDHLGTRGVLVVTDAEGQQYQLDAILGATEETEEEFDAVPGATGVGQVISRRLKRVKIRRRQLIEKSLLPPVFGRLRVSLDGEPWAIKRTLAASGSYVIWELEQRIENEAPRVHRSR